MTVFSSRGHRIDDSGKVLRIDSLTPLSFDKGPETGPEAEAFGRHAKALFAFVLDGAERLGPKTVRSRHAVIIAMLRKPDLMRAIAAGGPGLLPSINDLLEDDLAAASVRYTLHSFRRFYTWAAAQGFEGFTPEDARGMAGFVIGGPRPGRAVLSLDDEEGPLQEHQARALEDGLWLLADGTDQVALSSICASLLMLALGCNPESLRRLEEGDLERPPRAGLPFRLSLPRIKRRTGQPRRGEYKVRDIDGRLGMLVERLIAENLVTAPLDPDVDRECGRPLFRRKRGEEALLGTFQRAATFHAPDNYFYNALASVQKCVPIPEFKGTLTGRRLRYTFATRLIERGVPLAQVQELMDHSDLSTLMCYYNARLDLVLKLDRAMDVPLSVISDVYLGLRPVEDLRGLPGFRAPEPPVVRAPFACLDCPAFRPTDPLALLALADLLETERDRRKRASTVEGLTFASPLTAARARRAAEACTAEHSIPPAAGRTTSTTRTQERTSNEL